MDAALATIKEQPAGTVLLVAMAAGICFGAYCSPGRGSRVTNSRLAEPYFVLLSRRLRTRNPLFAPSAEGAKSGCLVKCSSGGATRAGMPCRRQRTIRSGIEKRRHRAATSVTAMDRRTA